MKDDKKMSDECSGCMDIARLYRSMVAITIIYEMARWPGEGHAEGLHHLPTECVQETSGPHRKYQD